MNSRNQELQMDGQPRKIECHQLLCAEGVTEEEIRAPVDISGDHR